LSPCRTKNAKSLLLLQFQAAATAALSMGSLQVPNFILRDPNVSIGAKAAVPECDGGIFLAENCIPVVELQLTAEEALSVIRRQLTGSLATAVAIVVFAVAMVL
jgi:hypothetical protein